MGGNLDGNFYEAPARENLEIYDRVGEGDSLSHPVLTVAQSRGVLAIPGVLTPSEIMSALTAGASLMKIFPCGNVGGPKYLKAERTLPASLDDPTGGVNASNAAEYLAAGAFALGIGGDLCDKAAIRSGNAAKVTAAARELVDSVKHHRNAP